MSSRRRLLLDSIAAKIRTATGYTTVEPWRENSFTPANLPAIAWRDRSSDYASHTIGRPHQLLSVVYAGYGFGGSAAMRLALEQMLAAIGSDTTQGGLAVSTTYRSSTIGVQVAGEMVCGCQLQVEILYEIIGEDLSTAGSRLIDENDNILTDENGDSLTW